MHCLMTANTDSLAAKRSRCGRRFCISSCMQECQLSRPNLITGNLACLGNGFEQGYQQIECKAVSIAISGKTLLISAWQHLLLQDKCRIVHAKVVKSLTDTTAHVGFSSQDFNRSCIFSNSNSSTCILSRWQ